MNNTTKKEKAPIFDIIYLVVCLAVFALLAGCATKTRHIDLAGAYASQAGTLAVGSIEIQSAPEGAESAMVAYEDDTSWFSDEKKHKIRILLTGTNSTASAGEIVKDICTAFTATATVLKGEGCKCADGCICSPCKCDPCKCGKREPSDKSEEPPPSIDEI